MEHLEDLSPRELRHVWLPNDTYDDLERTHFVSVAVLTGFLRHAERFGITLTKLEARAAGIGEAALSKAYNHLIDRSYLMRVEFSHTAPAGTKAMANQRYTMTGVSRVPFSRDTITELVRRHTPGKSVLINWPTGEVDEHGQEVYERRRVRITSAEIYLSRGALRIHPDGLLSLHERARGKEWKARNARLAAQLGDQVRFTLDTASAPPPPKDDVPPPAAAKAPPKGTKPQVAPEPGNPGSGLTRANTEDPQVAPEPGNPGSSKNEQENGQQNDQPARALAALGCAPDEAASGPARIDPAAPAPEVGPTQLVLGGDHQSAREDEAGAMTAEEARAKITETLNATKQRPRKPSRPRNRPLAASGATTGPTGL